MDQASAAHASTPGVAGSSFDAFYLDHRARLVAALNASERCGADLATDAIDEAFVRALAHWRRVERMDAPAGWVFTVARNHVRRSRSRRSTERELVGRARIDTDDVGAQPSWELWNAVAALPDRERLAIALRYLGDLTEKDVAKVMGIAPGTVAATLHKARQNLAAQLMEPVEARGPNELTTEVNHDV